ncbi:DUF4175 family protein, partial [Ameyamaea chiangmaiensis]
VLDLRRRLALGLETRDAAGTDLAALGEAPGPLSKDSGLFLNLTATASLLADPDVDGGAATAEAVGRLWDLALDLEDRSHGDRASAQASLDVRAAQERVEEQLRHMRELGPKGQSAEEQTELAHRMEALQQAIMRRMQALAQKALRDHTAIPNLDGMQNHANDALSRLMQSMRQDAENGRTGDALQKLQQMEDMTERMRNATPQDLASLARSLQATQAARTQMEGLGDIVKRQSALLDHTQDRQGRNRRAQDRAADAQSARGTDQDQDEDLSTLPTAELLRRLGLSTPGGSAPQPD